MNIGEGKVVRPTQLVPLMFLLALWLAKPIHVLLLYLFLGNVSLVEVTFHSYIFPLN